MGHVVWTQHILIPQQCHAVTGTLGKLSQSTPLLAANPYTYSMRSFMAPVRPTARYRRGPPPVLWGYGGSAAFLPVAGQAWARAFVCRVQGCDWL